MRAFLAFAIFRRRSQSVTHTEGRQTPNAHRRAMFTALCSALCSAHVRFACCELLLLWRNCSCGCANSRTTARVVCGACSGLCVLWRFRPCLRSRPKSVLPVPSLRVSLVSDRRLVVCHACRVNYAPARCAFSVQRYAAKVCHHHHRWTIQRGQLWLASLPYTAADHQPGC